MESATELVDAPRRQRASLKGEVTYVHAFDLAYDMKRQRIPQILGQTVQDYVVGPSKPGPKQGFFYRLLHQDWLNLGMVILESTIVLLFIIDVLLLLIGR
jgi:hypothetical protein